MWGFSLQFLQTVFFWATVTAAVAGGISITAAFVSAMVGYQVTDLVQADADKRIAEAAAKGDEARAGAAKANAEVAKANEAIAKANQRAAELGNEAAQARLEQERLKAQLAWRILPPALVNALTNALRQQLGQVNIEYVSNDTEALYFAIQISRIFGNAGWQVTMSSVTLGNAAVFGIFIPEIQPSPPLTDFIRHTFAANGIGFSTDPLPPPGMSFGNTIPNAPKVFIGSKPLPP